VEEYTSEQECHDINSAPEKTEIEIAVSKEQIKAWLEEDGLKVSDSSEDVCASTKTESDSGGGGGGLTGGVPGGGTGPNGEYGYWLCFEASNPVSYSYKEEGYIPPNYPYSKAKGEDSTTTGYYVSGQITIGPLNPASGSGGEQLVLNKRVTFGVSASASPEDIQRYTRDKLFMGF
jgi:hypothetical protein